MTKKWKKPKQKSWRCQGPSDGSLGGWSHDQFPKMVKKTKVVALHCSFQNLFESCSKVLLLWRYEVEHFEKHCVFFVFCNFLHENNTKSHDFNTFGNLWEGATTIVTWEKSPKKEGAYPKREIDTERLQRSLIDYNRLQKSDIDYKAY